MKQLIRGIAASPGTVYGKVALVKSHNQLDGIDRGSVLVAKHISPDLVTAFFKCVALVTDEGGLLSHAAVLSRELGIPCVVNAKRATKVLMDGTLVFVDGKQGVVYDVEG